MSISSYLLIITLLAPPPAPPIVEPATPMSDYEVAVAQMVALGERINFGEPVHEQLRDTLASLPRYTPQLAADSETQELRTQILLRLARSALADGDRDTAVRIVDEAIRSAMGVEIPQDAFGPSLEQLYEERRDALAAGGRGSIAVSCAQPCRVFVNEHETPQVIEDLPLGNYRVWIEGTHPSNAGHVLTDVVTLNVDAEVVTRVFDAGPVEVDTAEPARDDPARDIPPRDRDRIMPPMVESVILAAGVGLATAGALMLGLEPSRGELAAGGTLFAIGGAAAVVGGVTLAVDEVRIGKQRGCQTMVVWTARF